MACKFATRAFVHTHLALKRVWCGAKAMPGSLTATVIFYNHRALILCAQSPPLAFSLRPSNAYLMRISFSFAPVEVLSEKRNARKISCCLSRTSLIVILSNCRIAMASAPSRYKTATLWFYLFQRRVARKILLSETTQRANPYQRRRVSIVLTMRMYGWVRICWLLSEDPRAAKRRNWFCRHQHLFREHLCGNVSILDLGNTNLLSYSLFGISWCILDNWNAIYFQYLILHDGCMGLFEEKKFRN